MRTEPDMVVKKMNLGNPTLKIFLAVIVVALVAGISTGYVLAKNGSNSSGNGLPVPGASSSPTSAQADTSTFKDFAEGTLQKKPDPTSESDYTEGTHVLIRVGAVPVALTSSVVDLSQYEGKKVKVYGETQKATTAGWLMDVGKVVVEQ